MKSKHLNSYSKICGIQTILISKQGNIPKKKRKVKQENQMKFKLLKTNDIFVNILIIEVKNFDNQKYPLV